MKRFFRFLLVLIILAALLAGAAWYFLHYNSVWTTQFFADRGAGAMSSGKYSQAIRWYRWAEQLSPNRQELDVALADAYKASGNYTKAEFTLANAISQGATAEIYETLCRVYVEQDKLLDAVTMLDQIADSGVKAQLDARRPAAPQTDLEPGFYNQYVTIHLTAESGSLCVSTDRNYPSVVNPREADLTLTAGETTLTAVAVSESGLVSPLSVFGYTIAGVVEDVVLTDEALDACVRELLSRGSSSMLSTSDLWGITELEVPAETQDLSQLHLFTGLESLTIRDRSEIDLSFLTELTGLKCLVLDGCAVDPAQLELIGALGKLETLSMAGCQLSTLRGLEELTGLTTLDLSMNSISNLTPISGNTGLETLYLQNNAIGTAVPLSSMTALKTLNLSNNLLRDLSTVAACVNLKDLDVSVNNLAALNGVGNLTNLTSLNASSNKLTTIAGIGKCSKLDTLSLSNNQLTEMDEVASLAMLVNLDVSYNDLVTIPQFAKDSILSTFNGCHNFFEDVTGLADLQMLNYVYLDYNNISDINVLAGCPNLVQVNVFRTNVSDVSELEDRDIIISYNPT